MLLSPSVPIENDNIWKRRKMGYEIVKFIKFVSILLKIMLCIYLSLPHVTIRMSLNVTANLDIRSILPSINGEFF